MADYINTNILSQAYIHIEPRNLKTEDELNEFKEHLIKFARTRTDFYLYPNAEIEVEFKEGSLKAHITVYGTLLVLIEGISSYPDFREGISLLHSDSKRFAEYVISETQYKAGSKHQDVIRLEARTGVIGSVHKVINQLENIKIGSKGSYTAIELSKKIDSAQKELIKLLDNMDNFEDALLIMEGLRPIVNSIPETPSTPKDKYNTKYDINNYREKRKRLYEYFGMHSSF